MKSKIKIWSVAVVGVSLVVVNAIAWRKDMQASATLASLQLIASEQADIDALRREVGHQRSLLGILIEAFEGPEMTKSLFDAIESADLQDVLVADTDQNGWRDVSFYLYAPNDAHELVVKVAVSDKPTHRNPAQIGEPTKLLQVPLTAGKLHKVDVGFPQESKYSKFRVLFDDHELYTLGMNGKGSSGSSMHYGSGAKGLVQPATRGLHHGPELPPEHWYGLASRSFTVNRGKQREQIGFTIGLRTSGPIYIGEEGYWREQAKLNLVWEDETQRYRIESEKQ